MVAKQKQLNAEQLDLEKKNHEFVVTFVIGIMIFLVSAVMFRVYGDGAIGFLIFGLFIDVVRYSVVTAQM